MGKFRAILVNVLLIDMIDIEGHQQTMLKSACYETDAKLVFVLQLHVLYLTCYPEVLIHKSENLRFAFSV